MRAGRISVFLVVAAAVAAALWIASEPRPAFSTEDPGLNQEGDSANRTDRLSPLSPSWLDGAGLGAAVEKAQAALDEAEQKHAKRAVALRVHRRNAPQA